MACGYVDIKSAEEAGDSLCLFQNVSTFEELLSSKVVNCTSKAQLLGLKPGMKGVDVLDLIK